MLSVKPGGIKYHFLSLWYDSTWDWTPVSRTIGEHCTHGSVLPVYGFPKDTLTAITMLYKTAEAIARSPDGDIDFFDIAEVL